MTGPHSAGLGIKFYTGNMFPKSYQNVAFIARHGSWNREKKFGYDVAIARTSGGKAKIEPFLTGLLNEEKNEFYGRPSYVFQMKDGSLLVSDERGRLGDPRDLGQAREPVEEAPVIRVAVARSSIRTFSSGAWASQSSRAAPSDRRPARGRAAHTWYIGTVPGIDTE